MTVRNEQRAAIAAEAKDKTVKELAAKYGVDDGTVWNANRPGVNIRATWRLATNASMTGYRIGRLQVVRLSGCGRGLVRQTLPGVPWQPAGLLTTSIRFNEADVNLIR